ncbi:hypothetical protein [Moraxella lacunata]
MPSNVFKNELSSFYTSGRLDISSLRLMINISEKCKLPLFIF